MPYPRLLQEYLKPEFFAEAPASWVKRLRETSPVADRQPYLIFRVFGLDDREREGWGWVCKERPMWTLYIATPRKAVSPERAALYVKHWSEMATEGEKVARHSMISDYQHFMWHSQGVDVAQFLLLQGPTGATIAKYSKREKRYLDGIGATSEEFPIGFLPAQPFDERTVTLIQTRERMMFGSRRFDSLDGLNASQAEKAEAEEAERVFREEWVKTWGQMNGPVKEFLGSQIGKAAMADGPRASRKTTDHVTSWKDQYIATGVIPGQTNRTMQRSQRPLIYSGA